MTNKTKKPKEGKPKAGKEKAGKEKAKKEVCIVEYDSEDDPDLEMWIDEGYLYYCYRV